MLELLIGRHQLHVTINSVLLGRMLLLLAHDDLQGLVVLVRELMRVGWCSRHEHDVLRRTLS